MLPKILTFLYRMHNSKLFTQCSQPLMAKATLVEDSDEAITRECLEKYLIFIFFNGKVQNIPLEHLLKEEEQAAPSGGEGLEQLLSMLLEK